MQFSASEQKQNSRDEVTPWVLSLGSPLATLALCGGKGANLARLARANFPVPGGFIVTTEAYTEFVAANHLEREIQAVIEHCDFADPSALEEASSTLRGRFTIGQMSENLIADLSIAYQQLGYPAVAVRSSATAEDLPDLSFAGQQDTYLNIVGEEALLDAVIRCWSSLWTARAIGYRARNQIRTEGLSLAVVVQAMIPSEASGVLFTANPLTGKRSETVIDATLGLGEALVSGLVEPDHYVVEEGRILQKVLGAKEISIRGTAGGGTARQAENASTVQALPDDVVLHLAELGKQVADLYQFPQDIEWAWAHQMLYLLQARPITTLYPPIKGFSEDGELAVTLSFGAVQGMLDPITPLGRDVFRYMAGAIGSFLYSPMTADTQGALYEAGERLFIQITPILRNPLGRKFIHYAFPLIEPGSVPVLDYLIQDARLSERPGRRIPEFRTLRKLIPGGRRILFNLLWPTRGRKNIQRRIEQIIAQVHSLLAPTHNLDECIRAMVTLFEEMAPFFMQEFIPMVASGQVPLQLLRFHIKDAGSIWELTRGLPHNVTTEMDLVLWETAQQIRSHEDAATYFLQHRADQLAAEFLAGSLPPTAQSAASNFLHTYGHRGVGEIDMGRPRWNEDPTPVMQSLLSCLAMKDPTRAPDVVFEQSKRSAEQALERFIAASRKGPLGFIRAARIRWFGKRVRELAGLRETPKFTIMRIFAIMRAAFLKQGEILVRTGTFEQADDILFLNMAELKQIATGYQRNWQALVHERRQAYVREKGRRLIPRILLSDGTAFYEGVSPDSGSGETLTGSPVSPGVIEGRVHIVFDPHAVRLVPGEILVCPGTDPAWTPLFLTAGGLIMEVGGMMTHGAVVAREYGIPAVVGVTHATLRLQNGDLIRMDGSTGMVQKLNESE